MRIAESKYGTIIFGVVQGIKPGSGRAADSLTIVTVTDGNRNDTVKVLFWNSSRDNGAKLSDRARKMSVGTCITARVIWDEGDPHKCTGYELKYSGMYRLSSYTSQTLYVLHGKVAKVTKGRGVTMLWIPVNRYHAATVWYRLSLWGIASVENEILKGDIIAARSNILKESHFNDMNFWDMSAVRLESIHGTYMAHKKGG